MESVVRVLYLLDGSTGNSDEIDGASKWKIHGPIQLSTASSYLQVEKLWHTMMLDHFLMLQYGTLKCDLVLRNDAGSRC